MHRSAIAPKLSRSKLGLSSRLEAGSTEVPAA